MASLLSLVPMNRSRPALLLFGLSLLAASFAAEPADRIRRSTTAVDDNRLRAAGPNSDDWPTHGLDYAETRFSRLEQINTGNVKDLGLAWSHELGTRRGIEATPIVIDGYMFMTGPWSVVYAFDARTGKKLWEWDPQVDKAVSGPRACCDVVNRGVAVHQGRVYVGVLDGRLAALEAATGKVVWETLTVDPAKPFTITGAPRVYQGKVIIGNGGAEFGVRGYVSAYDAATGQLAWRTHTVPGDPALGFESAAMEMAAKTWTGEWWKHGGGGTCWNSFSHDPALGLVYVGTGNGATWNRLHRSPGGGDNLFLSSILALRLHDGSYVWHYQTTPGDTWDFTATEHMILADLEIAGRPRQVIMQAPKNGFFYVLDRRTGEFLSAKPYASITWASGVDPATGRPIEVPGARYEAKPAAIRPSPQGAHNWQPMAYHPGTGLVYFPVQELQRIFEHDPLFRRTVQSINSGVNSLGDGGFVPSGHLVAWDPRTQAEAWRVSHVTPGNGGVVATAGGLVFQGTGDGRLIAVDARNGKLLWDKFLGLGIIAPPVTYRVDGRQYVTVAAGWGGGGAQRIYGGPRGEAAKFEQVGRVFTFALGAREPIPMPPARIARTPIGREIPLSPTPEQLARGRRLYAEACIRCHGLADPKYPGSLPDLRFSLKETLTDLFHPIVYDGAYAAAKGMPAFKADLTRDDVEAIRAYIVTESRKLAAAAP